ncbi:MAG: protein kinase [Acidobacteriota bacterium]
MNEGCANDPKLRAEVQKLLDSFERSDDFIEHPAANEVASLLLDRSPTLKEGQRFAHYEIIRQIGEGGMGEVYLAQDGTLDRKVAIKILNDRFSGKESNLKRFVQEAKAASSLNHPNILVIHEISISDDANYIVSEYVEGKTLREVIQESRVTLSEILDITIQISNALATAHGADLIHRDIKPENVILRPDGYVKILDFGLAKLLNPKSIGLEASTVAQNETAKGIIMGTVNYMSPEQAKAEKVDERTDIFSLGVVIYELVAGKTPFAGDSISETFANLINREPQPLTRFTANVPEELQRIVVKTLRKNKDDRYQSIKELYSDLKTLREDLAFDKRVESSLPFAGKKTAVLPVTTGIPFENTVEAKQNTTGEMIRRKPYSIIAVSIILIGLMGAGYYFFWGNKASSGPGARKSLAVLPFVNSEKDPNVEYLSNGITENIVNNLSQLSSLRVISTNSAFLFKNDQSDTRTIAKKLGVETLVTGDIRRLDDKLIINVHLINAADDSAIWGNQYVRPATDILAAQNEIALAVAQNLRLKLTGVEQRQLAKRPTENVEAYDLYLRGRSQVFKLTPAEINSGIKYFEQAIKIDPNYALAYAGISDAYRSLALGSEMDPTLYLPKSSAAANKAIETDDTLSEAYTSLGATNFWSWDWNAAESNSKRALVLNPSSAAAHLFYAHLLSNLGRNSEALAEIKVARESEPLFPFVGALEGQFLLHAGKLDESIERLQKTIELAPNFWMPHLFISSAYIEKGMFDEAIAEARKAEQLSPAQTVSMAFAGYALARSGRRDEARIVLEKLLKLSNDKFIPQDHIAMIYNGLGETDKALEWLEKGYDAHDPKMAFLKVEPKWNNLRSEPRFVELMKKMNFEEK